MKPRVVWRYYHQLKQGYWRVASPDMSWHRDTKLKALWSKAYEAVARANIARKGYPFQ